MSLSCALPEFCRELLAAHYGASDIERIQLGYEAKRLVSLRINTLKTNLSAVERVLSDCGIAYHSVGWYRDALTVEATEAQIASLSLYERGEIYLQSLSSMLPPLYLGARAGESVLDMTAAPGGKTTQIAALTEGKALITACERDPVRFERLSYNIKKQGAPRVTLLKTDASKLDDFFKFDRILLDAPCSGSGTISMQEEISVREKTLKYCMRMQSALLEKAIKLVKKGGEIVYSTCSVFPCENQDVINAALNRDGVELAPLLPISPELPLLPGKEGTLTVCPSVEYEGFFIAKLKKL